MAAKKTSPKKLTKSAFIRSQPTEMSAAEIVAKGKAAGMKISDSLVYMVRGPRDGKGSPKKGGGVKKSASKKVSPKKVPASKKTATAKKPSISTKSVESKADFVRARAHLSPKEIVEDAKAQGLKLEASYVYNVRGQDKAISNKKQRATKKSPPSPKATSTSKPVASNGTRPSGSVEELLKAAAAELGLGKAIEVLQAERARVRAVLGG